MKTPIISKELLSEVLNLNITYIERCNNSIIYKISVYDREEEANIYELAHKCKKWAKSKEFIIHSSPTQKIEYTAIVQSFDFNKFYYGQNQFYALSEYEAIFEACQWILDQRTNKCTEQ